MSSSFRPIRGGPTQDRPLLSLGDGPHAAKLLEAQEIARSAEVKPNPKLLAWTADLLIAVDAWRHRQFAPERGEAPISFEASEAVNSLGLPARDPEILRFAHDVVTARDNWRQKRMQRKGR